MLTSYVEKGQYAETTLKETVQCYEYDNAFAYGDDAICFIPTFPNWGWTNPILSGTYEMDLLAGAAEFDNDEGALVGNVTVVYDHNTL